MTQGEFFQDLAMLMTLAGLTAIVFTRFGWPKVLGYIGAGIFMNPYTWGGSFIASPQTVQTLGQLGVVFLMFGMGLSFSAREMRQIRGVALPAAVLDTVVMIWLGYTIGTRFFGWSGVQSFFLGVAICDSATTLLAKVLDEMGWASRPFAKCVLGTSVCEDIICVGAIAVATGFANGGGMSAGAFAISLGWLAVFFLSVLVFGFIFVPRLLVSVGKRHDSEALLLAVLGCCFCISYFADRFNFSLALGAFLVGVVASSSDVKLKIEAMMDPLKSMFSAVFFISIGLLVDPVALWHNLPQILLVSAVVVVGKTFNNTFASIATGLDVKAAVQNGMSLAQIGEFAFMVAILYAGITGDARNSMFQIAVGVSLLTTILNPTFIRLSDRLGDLAERSVPPRVARWLETYRAWIRKIGADTNSPAFKLLKSSLLKLGVYAVLMLSVYAGCALLYRLDYSRFSEFFERNDQIVFFLISNVFAISLTPLVVYSANSAADEVASLLLGYGEDKWQVAVRQVVRFTTLAVVVSAFFAEWTMLNVATAPERGWSLEVTLAVIVLIGAFGWRLFVKAGRRATVRLQEALTAEERRESLQRTISMASIVEALHRITVEAGSPAVGGSVVTLNLRARTGATVVSVRRGDQVIHNVGPELTFEAGDVVVAAGDPNQLSALKQILCH